MRRIAVPVREQRFCEHLGQSDSFLLCDLAADRRSLERFRTIPRPKAGCESLPEWLQALGVTDLLAGGAGAVAAHHLRQRGIKLSAGHSGDDPEKIAERFLRDGHPADSEASPCLKESAHRHHHCRK